MRPSEVYAEFCIIPFPPTLLTVQTWLYPIRQAGIW
jgi:hypothetical protein